MPRPLLPPLGVFVATPLMFDLTIPPAVRLTGIQLRALAWGNIVTPPLRIQEISSLTGKSQASIYEHMSLLRDIGVLSWRTTEQGMIMLTFSPEYSGSRVNPKSHDKSYIAGKDSKNLEPPAIHDSKNLESFSQMPADSENLESPINTSDHTDTKILVSDHVLSDPLVSLDHMNPDSDLYPPDVNKPQPSLTNLINHSDLDGVKEMQVNDLNLDKSTNNHRPPGGERECEGERGEEALNPRSKTTRGAGVSTFNFERLTNVSPQSIYTNLTDVIPTPEQSTRMDLRVKDLTTWEDSIRHWLEHGWSPKNVALLLEVYARGGAKGCFFCAHGNHPRRTFSPPEDKA